jgi:hypothetical protein
MKSEPLHPSVVDALLSALHSSQPHTAQLLTEALAQKDATIKALAGELLKARVHLRPTQPEYHTSFDALRLAGVLK